MYYAGPAPSLTCVGTTDPPARKDHPMTTTPAQPARMSSGRTAGLDPSVQNQDGPEEPEWGRSTDLLAHERRNLTTFEDVFPHWNDRDVPSLLEHYTEDITWHNVAMGETYHGRAEVGAFLSELFRGLPDLSLEVTLRLPRGRYVAEEYVIRGTHLGSVFGLPPTGRRLEIQAMSMVELANGKLKEDHFYYDSASVLRQMGLLPPVQAARTLWGGAALRLLVHRRFTAGVAAAAGLGGLLVAAGRHRRP
jgi:steroid delta-isomerase-like uncharacterized protein